MKEHSHLSVTGGNAQQDELIPEQDSIELIESEMDILRQRMKRLETRMQRLTGKSTTTPLASTVAETRPSDSANPQSSIILTPTTANQNTSSPTRRRHSKKPVRTDAKRPIRTHRKRRSSKVKKNFLLGYGLLIGVGVVSVFVLMVLNLFNADIYIPSGEPEIEIDETPDLEELRMSIQDAEE